MEDDHLRLEELTPRGGEWSGLVFDNPKIDLAPALTWTFRFDFEELQRHYGTTSPSLTVDWVPLPGATWSAMAGRSVAVGGFAAPVESSFYFFDHMRYDSVELRILEQSKEDLRVVAAVEGDIDGLGIDRIEADAQLEFSGIWLQLHDVTTVTDAERRLAQFTETAGLACESTSHAFRFAPAR